MVWLLVRICYDNKTRLAKFYYYVFRGRSSAENYALGHVTRHKAQAQFIYNEARQLNYVRASDSRGQPIEIWKITPKAILK